MIPATTDCGSPSRGTNRPTVNSRARSTCPADSAVAPVVTPSPNTVARNGISMTNENASRAAYAALAATDRSSVPRWGARYDRTLRHVLTVGPAGSGHRGLGRSTAIGTIISSGEMPPCRKELR